MTYLVDRPLTVSANLGFDGSQYPDREKNEADANDPNNDDSQVSLRFGGSAIYAPDSTSALEASVNQTSGSDADGDRIITRSFALNGSRRFGDRVTLIVGGRFLQFQDGDELNGGSTDRIEFTSGLNITLTKSIAFSMGYNYADQDGGEDPEFSFASSGDSYTSHRAFIGVNGGIVGM
jgi:hypothetical protein